MKTNKAIRITTLVVLLLITLVALTVFVGAYDLYGSAFFASEFFKETKASKYAGYVGDCEKNQIVFFGDSITEMYDLNKYYPDKTIYNRGISGDTTTHMVQRLQSNLIDLAPDTVFLLGGANDLNTDIALTQIADNLDTIITAIQEQLPQTKIIVQSVYPFNYTHKLYGMLNLVSNRKNEDVVALNQLINNICMTRQVTFVDSYSQLVKNGQLNPNYSLDGLHINSNAYELITSLLSPYIYDQDILTFDLE